MALPEPSWRIKTRPCPFYQQGRCLFADSCNFLHNVSVKPRATQVDAPRRHSLNSPPNPQTPTVTVHSPRSVRSPRRSPRLSGLLLALKDIIGEDEDDEMEDASDEETDPNESLTLVNDIARPTKSDTLVHDSGSSSQNVEDPWTLIHDSGTTSIPDSERSPDDKGATDSDLLAPSNGTVPDEDDHTIRANPTSSAIKQTTPSLTPDLLSPVDVSNLPLVPFVRDDFDTVLREDSIDSGYADNWTSPCPLLMSPPRSPALSSTFDLLSSPFGSPSARVLSPRLSAFIARAPPSPLGSTFVSPTNSPVDGEVLDLSLDSMSPLDDDSDSDSSSESEGEQTAKFAGKRYLDPDISAVIALPSSIQPVISESADFQEEDIPPFITESMDDEQIFHDYDDQIEDLPSEPSTEAWDSEGEPTAVFLGTQGEVDDSSSVDPIDDEAEYNSPLPSPSSIEQPLEAAPSRDSIETNLLLPTNEQGSNLDQVSDLALDKIDSGHRCSTSSPLHFSTTEPTGFDDGEVEENSTPGNSSPHFQSVEDEAEIRPAFSSPDLSGQESSQDGPPESVNEGLDDGSDEGSPVMSPTAHLGYLSSPTLVHNENDTIYSLYDHYYSASTPPESRIDVADPFRQSSSPLAATRASSSHSTDRVRAQTVSTPTTSSFPRGRVFTPPLVGRVRSGTITTASPDSPSSLSPAPPALGSPLRGRPISASAKAKGKYPAQSPVGDGQEVEVSTKVPFGFRHSFALGRAKNSSLMSNRISKNVSPFMKPKILTSQVASESESSRASPTDQQYLSPTDSPPRLKPLRLSAVLSLNSPISPISSSQSSNSRSHSTRSQSRISNRSSISSASVSSGFSLSNNPLLSSARSSLIPEHIRNTLILTHDESLPISTSEFLRNLSSLNEPHSAPASHLQSWSTTSDNRVDSHPRVASRLSEPALGHEDEDYEDRNDDDVYDHTIRRPVPVLPHTAPVTRPTSTVYSPHAIATPSPTLLFAIASDDVAQVRRVLESGGASPNDTVGPQSALAFTLTNDQLIHKMDIVKTLLAFGADPAALKNPQLNPPQRRSPSENDTAEAVSSRSPPPATKLDGMDPATRYYIARADEPHTRRTSALIHRSFFRPLTRVRYELIGQDRALEQLFRVLSIHSHQLSVAPIVVLLCGPSGHGKSLLARKFGSLLDVPTHTVNMTTLRSTHDIWKSCSMNPYEEPSTCTLAEFLVDNEGKRCIVVLDEIEKTEDEKALWSLLVPWELGRCSFEAGGRHVDVRNVIWLGTSNLGHDLVFEHQTSRELPDELMSREEYIQLMGQLRPRVSERLGASVLSRVTTVLPFVPFTLDEKRAISAEALYSLAGELVRTLASQDVERIISGALLEYSPTEGARSLYRAVSSQLIDVI